MCTTGKKTSSFWEGPFGDALGWVSANLAQDIPQVGEQSNLAELAGEDIAIPKSHLAIINVKFSHGAL